MILTDSTNDVRAALSSELSKNNKFDEALAQQENVEILFISISDINFSVRQSIFKVIGRISHLNPTLVMPKVR